MFTMRAGILFKILIKLENDFCKKKNHVKGSNVSMLFDQNSLVV